MFSTNKLEQETSRVLLIFIDYAKKIFSSAYYPLVRIYARLFLKDRPADPLLRGMCAIAFLVVYHYWPDFVRPRRFGEKLWSRMLLSRNPLLTTISDKLLVRDYVAKKAGADHLIPLLWSGDKPEAIPYDRLPDKFVIKTNHGCQYNILVTDKGRADRRAIGAKLTKWLAENYAEDAHLGIIWGYKNIKPVILIEEFIDDHGQPPIDYKFYCFSGRTELITVHFDRHKVPRSVSVDRDFVRLRFRPGFKQQDIDPPKPRNFAAMLRLAESLAEGFNFVRVDLYSLQDKIYFGELTPYPVGVGYFRSFDIVSLDETLGEKWGSNPEWV
jgi:hypothetical protein